MPAPSAPFRLPRRTQLGCAALVTTTPTPTPGRRGWAASSPMAAPLRALGEAPSRRGAANQELRSRVWAALGRGCARSGRDAPGADAAGEEGGEVPRQARGEVPSPPAWPGFLASECAGAWDVTGNRRSGSRSALTADLFRILKSGPSLVSPLFVVCEI